MIKYLLTLGTMGLILFGGVGPANATLINLANGTIHDDRGSVSNTSDDLYWYSDLSDFTNMNYNETLAAMGSISIGSGWHLADNNEILALRTYVNRPF